MELEVKNILKSALKPSATLNNYVVFIVIKVLQ